MSAILVMFAIFQLLYLLIYYIPILISSYWTHIGHMFEINQPSPHLLIFCGYHLSVSSQVGQVHWLVCSYKKLVFLQAACVQNDQTPSSPGCSPSSNRQGRYISTNIYIKTTYIHIYIYIQLHSWLLQWYQNPILLVPLCITSKRSSGKVHKELSKHESNLGTRSKTEVCG